ncbi:hypothetical protein FRC03_007736 [Tulasnella sp. 419]|nr:hypothetical protein FRC03_007736 [Tulasnella sp. 419]
MPLEQRVENQADTSTPSNQKRPRGRPRKVVNDHDPVKPKNPRGCPPKRPIEIIQQGVVGHLPGEDVIRRPVGRPPKNSDDNDSGVEVSFQHSTVAGFSSTRWIMQGGRIGVAPIATPEVTSPAPLMPDATGGSPAIASMVHNVDDANSGLSLSAPVLPLIPEIDPNRRVTDDDDDTDEEGVGVSGQGLGGDEDENEDDDDTNATPGHTAHRKPSKPWPKWVSDAFEKVKDKYLKNDLSGQPMLYTKYQTFWAPCASPFFILNKTETPTPSSLFHNRFFYWDPEILVQNGLNCPKCSTHLHRHGLHHRPRRVVELEDQFWLIGMRYRCRKCVNPKSGKSTVTFLSWDPAILASLPPSLACEFPAKLTHRSGVSNQVFTLLRSCLQNGLGAKAFSDMLRTLHRRHFDMLQIHIWSTCYIGILTGMMVNNTNHLEHLQMPMDMGALYQVLHI